MNILDSDSDEVDYDEVCLLFYGFSGHIINTTCIFHFRTMERKTQMNDTIVAAAQTLPIGRTTMTGATIAIGGAAPTLTRWWSAAALPRRQQLGVAAQPPHKIETVHQPPTFKTILVASLFKVRAISRVNFGLRISSSRMVTVAGSSSKTLCPIRSTQVVGRTMVTCTRRLSSNTRCTGI